MMAVSCSCESLPPSDFKLVCSLDASSGLLGAIKVAVENCQLCGSSKRPFYCKDCVNRGCFTRSRSSKTNDSFSDKVKKWLILKRERSRLLERFDPEAAKKICFEKKRAQIAEARDRLSILKSAVKDVEEELDKDKVTYSKLQESNRQQSAKAERHKEKTKRICRYIDKSINYASMQREALHRADDELMSIKQRHIKHLQEFIFPIQEIQPRSEVDAMAQSMVSALAEARHTAYVRGRWIYTDNSGELHYRIVEPSLPGNGDYSSSAYNIWLMENKAEEPDFEPSQRNPLYNISAALSYTTQMLNVLAHFLNINLPHKLCYSEFHQELSERQFRRAIYKLNHNILHACFTQDVPLENIHPRHTIHNLILLLNTPHLGRTGFFLTNPALINSIEEVRHDMESSSSSSSDNDNDEFDSGHIPTSEWEHVPVTLPEASADISYFVSTQMQSRMGSGGTADTQATTSIAGGLMTSAAASVASLWRVATGQKGDK